MIGAQDTVQTIDGVDVHIEGNGADTLVMVHGWPDTYRLWDAQVAFLQARHRCVRFTLPGFDIGKPARAVSLDEIVATLKHIVETTCPGGKVTLLLHDWGCVFGYQFAMRHPELVQRIVGVDVGDAGSRAHLQGMLLKAKAMVFAYQAWLVIAWRIGGRIGDRMTRAMARAARCRSDPTFIGAAMNYPYDIAWTGAHGGYRHAVPFVPCWPMLYLYGRRKPFQFQSAAWLEALRARPGSQALEFDTGHWVMKNKPQEFNHAVAAWLEATAAAR
jgi:cis-3-alkyl-4-acyloxetan-2-one decarboxylase